MSNKKKSCALTTISKTMDWFVVDSMRNLAKNGFDVTLVCDMDEEFIKLMVENADTEHIYVIEENNNNFIISCKFYKNTKFFSL